jgi:hypothetical protein
MALVSEVITVNSPSFYTPLLKNDISQIMLHVDNGAIYIAIIVNISLLSLAVIVLVNLQIFCRSFGSHKDPFRSHFVASTYVISLKDSSCVFPYGD